MRRCFNREYSDFCDAGTVAAHTWSSSDRIQHHSIYSHTQEHRTASGCAHSYMYTNVGKRYIRTIDFLGTSLPKFSLEKHVKSFCCACVSALFTPWIMSKTMKERWTLNAREWAWFPFTKKEKLMVPIQCAVVCMCMCGDSVWITTKMPGCFCMSESNYFSLSLATAHVCAKNESKLERKRVREPHEMKIWWKMYGIASRESISAKKRERERKRESGRERVCTENRINGSKIACMRRRLYAILHAQDSVSLIIFGVRITRFSFRWSLFQCVFMCT